MAVIGGAELLAVAAFFRDAPRSHVVRMDQAGGLGRGEVGISPGENRTQAFGSVAFAMCSGGQHPASLGNVPQGRIEIALIVREAQLADKALGGLLFRDPVAEAEE